MLPKIKIAYSAKLLHGDNIALANIGKAPLSTKI